jgi:LmbE family N-acetylglucosaminyl deacetylase
LVDIAEALYAAMKSVENIGAIVTHAWEGGHPDHDAAHLLGLFLAQKLGVLEHSRAVSFYRASASKTPLFIVQYPPPGGQGYRRAPITWSEAWDMALAVRYYPSQTKTFLGLAPWVFARALFDRSLWIQSLARSTAPERPVQTPLLSETRFGVSFEHCADRARAFLMDPLPRK